MTRGVCQAGGCRARVLTMELFCSRHRMMLESDTARVLARTFRPSARRQSAVFETALEEAQREILYFQMNGHKSPREQPFEWDDEPPAPRGA